jgi:hypothetical protein
MYHASWTRRPSGKGFAVLVVRTAARSSESVVIFAVEAGDVLVVSVVIGWKHAFAAVSAMGMPERYDRVKPLFDWN